MAHRSGPAAHARCAWLSGRPLPPSSWGGSSPPPAALLASRDRSTPCTPAGGLEWQRPPVCPPGSGWRPLGPQLLLYEEGGSLRVGLVPCDPLLPVGREQPLSPGLGPLACLINKADKI
ncbi:Hypothetical predicted protein [Marmota monax]|uniref:Uncharacterized protein n=1 Tax=Marmota monax TaxID=9995 RepID=A0A5E4AA47_MARMO|nr:hypothetical protein GHT09_004148 [Marmota monax]VTJ53880.1 Hypothetical predicted protein [Marmota monax]